MQAGRHRDGVLLLVHAAGKGVERGVLHHLQLRHRNAARDAEIFQQIVEPRLLLPRHVLTAGHHVDQRLVELVGDPDPDRGADGGERRGPEQVVPRLAQQPLQRGVVLHRHGGERARIHHHVDEEEQADQQHNRAPPVRLDVGVETVGCCHARYLSSRPSNPQGCASRDPPVRSVRSIIVAPWVPGLPRKGSVARDDSFWSELHLRRLLDLRARLAEVEERVLAEAERARDQHGREVLDAGVVFLHGVVEEAPRRRELVLDV